MSDRYIRYPGAIITSGNFPLLAPDGSAGAPSYSFSSDPTTGMYFSATRINWSVAGTLKLFLSATTLNFAGDTFRLGSNSTSEVAVCNNNSTGTGFMTFSGNNTSSNGGSVVVYGASHATKANIIEFKTAGSPRTQIDASGHLVPFADLSYNLGSSSQQWLTGFFSALRAATISSTTGNAGITIAADGGTAVKGSTTGTTQAAGIIGQIIDSGAITTINATSTQYVNIGSIPLTAGNWLVTGTARSELNTGVAMTRNIFALSVNSANTTTDQVAGWNQLEVSLPTATADTSCSIPNYPISVNTNTTFYWKYRADFSSGQPRVNGARLIAVRT